MKQIFTKFFIVSMFVFIMVILLSSNNNANANIYGCSNGTSTYTGTTDENAPCSTRTTKVECTADTYYHVGKATTCNWQNYPTLTPTVIVTATPSTVQYNNPSVVTWTTTNANSCSLTRYDKNNPDGTLPEVVPINAGLKYLYPGYNSGNLITTTTFKIECVNNPDLYPDGSPIGSPNSYELPLIPCFISETKVDMADGTTKNIEEVKVGDVLKGEKTNNTVLGLHKSILNGKLYSLNGGRYFVTDAHPFKTTDGWKSINPGETAKENIGITVTKLEVGDTLITDKGNVLLKTINSKEGKANTKLFNFYLNGDHTYYADDYLVHNKMACDAGPTNKCLTKNICVAWVAADNNYQPISYTGAYAGECAPCPDLTFACASGYTATCTGTSTQCTQN
jgi:hypothetical protein